MTKTSAFQETYVRAAGAVAFVTVVNTDGAEGIGSAFHIGEGVFVTARHVVDGVSIREVATTKSVRLAEEADGRTAPPRRFEIVEGPYFGPEGLDVAVFRVNLGTTPLPVIAVSQHTDYELGENDLVLSDILIVGYPPVPFTTIPSQIVTLGQINAVVRVRHAPVLHFIASAMARGGFSGGPALNASGVALGLVTESLGYDGTPVETGYMSLLSIEPAVDLAAEKFGHDFYRGPSGRYEDTLFAAKFSDPSSQSLSSFIHDAGVYVYDDDRDVFVEIDCQDEELLAEAVGVFHAVTPITRQEAVEYTALYIPDDNPPAALLAEAGEAVAAVFDRAGYRKMASVRSPSLLKKKV
ncbi:Peptidase C24 Calicivirus polyprotein ORF 1 [Rhizobium leguminosarum bv. trifolii WSM1325]|uniref:Peptidase C24 Calicivirus polyprotein ORF 1 n=1 Tax=Rhizobium leguminosarum bv. trifolii (strain WSM1325) TaxID=395491 RepID=C6AVQ8_RHILS|nr:Peptidase C24 Calicivirus polyprotein ORF 1 [Rhizobium leguminosarum bv. trifolii WSM1325]